jgi:hypothetical protein
MSVPGLDGSTTGNSSVELDEMATAERFIGVISDYLPL